MTATRVGIHLALLLLSTRALGQAEPAPANYIPPGRRTAPAERAHPTTLERWHLMLYPRLNLRLGDAPASLPRLGWGAGVEASYAFITLGALRFGVGAAFAFDRFEHDRKAVGTPQFVEHASFAALLVLDALLGPGNRLRPFIAAGGGFSVANYADPQPPSVSEVAVVGLFKAEAGLAVRVYSSVELGVHGEVDATFSSFQTGTPPTPAFAPGLVAFALDLGFRF